MGKASKEFAAQLEICRRTSTTSSTVDGHKQQDDDGVDPVIQALDELRLCVAQHDDDVAKSQSRLSSPNDDDGDDDGLGLLMIEQKAAELRMAARNFHQLQRQKTVFRALPPTISNHHQSLTSLTLANRSLCAASRKRIFREQKDIDSIFDILQEHVYGNIGNPTAERQLEFGKYCQNVANSLRRTQNATFPQSDFLQSLVEESTGNQTMISETREFPIIKMKKSELELVLQLDQQGARKPSLVLDKQPAEIVDKISPEMASFQVFGEDSPCGIHRQLMIAPEGGGKTHVCNQIESLVGGQGTKVHRLNACGRTTGEMEDNVISMFCKSHEKGKHVLLVDNFDEIAITEDGNRSTGQQVHENNDKQRTHASARTLASFLAMLDSSYAADDDDDDDDDDDNKVAMVCTAKTNSNNTLDRFDSLQRIETPSEAERREAVIDFLNLPRSVLEPKRETHSEIQSTLMKVVSSTAGLSFAEISQRCSSAMLNMESDNQLDDIVVSASLRLHAVSEALQSLAPASLLSHLVDGYIDMRVSSGRELMGMSQGSAEVCPLLGHESELAWKELEWNIVIPISRAAELSLLTHHRQEQRVGGKSLRGGVLLSGIPGSGKSTLTRHCARFAASYLPSVKLIEVSCSSMIHKEVGASERAIHRLFEFARSAMPCIVVLDDVAIVAAVRGKDNTKEGTMDRVLSTLLHEMDGIEQSTFSAESVSGMAVIGVTKDATKVDAALLRPGRLGRTVTLGAPEQDARRRIALRELESNFGQLLEEIGSTSATTLTNTYEELSELIAESTEGFSGASVVALLIDARGALAKAMRGSTNDTFEVAQFIRSFITECK